MPVSLTWIVSHLNRFPSRLSWMSVDVAVKMSGQDASRHASDLGNLASGRQHLRAGKFPTSGVFP